MKITILYGTETGNAEMLAEDIQAEFEAAHDVNCQNLSETSPDDLAPDRFYLLVCSTYGDGDLPASAQPFGAALTKAQPDLSQVHFAIFGLGDSEYDETFNHGPQKLATLMTACGAIQLGPRIAHDASGADLAEDLAMPWASAVIALAQATLGISA